VSRPGCTAIGVRHFNVPFALPVMFPCVPVFIYLSPVGFAQGTRCPFFSSAQEVVPSCGFLLFFFHFFSSCFVRVFLNVLPQGNGFSFPSSCSIFPLPFLTFFPAGLVSLFGPPHTALFPSRFPVCVAACAFFFYFFLTPKHFFFSQRFPYTSVPFFRVDGLFFPWTQASFPPRGRI